MTPGVACAPESGNDSRCWTWAAVVSPNTGELARIRSSSRYRREARSIALQPGTNAGLASNGRAYGHLSWLSAAGGRPAPNPLPWLQSHRIWLNQSPELNELRSSDLER